MSTEATNPTAASTPAAPADAAQAPVTPPPQTAPAEPPKPAEKPPTARDWTAIRAQEARLSKEREAVKQQAKEAAEARARLDEIEKLAKENPDEVLKRLGLSYDEITKRRLNARKTPEEVAREAAKAEAQRLLDEREQAATKAREEAESKAAEQHWETVSKAFSDHVAASGEAHELLRVELESSPEDVQAVLRAMAQQRPDLTIDKAADLYEQHLLEQTKRRLGLSKVRALMQPPASAEGTKPSTTTAPGAESGRDGTGDGARTLTNGHAQERATAASAPQNPANRHREAIEEEQERLRRAMALLP